MLSPYVIGQIDPTGTQPTSGQSAFATTIAMLAGGGLAGALGQNAIGGAAENQVQNNDLRHLLVVMGLLSPLSPDAQDAVSLGATAPADTLQEELKDNVKPLVVPIPFGQNPPPK